MATTWPVDADGWVRDRATLDFVLAFPQTVKAGDDIEWTPWLGGGITTQHVVERENELFGIRAPQEKVWAYMSRLPNERWNLTGWKPSNKEK